METKPNATADMVRQRRAELGITQEEAASRGEISRRTWTQIEGGRRRGNVTTLAKMDTVLGLPAGSLAALDADEPSDDDLAAIRQELIAMIKVLASREELEAVRLDMTRRRLATLEARVLEDDAAKKSPAAGQAGRPSAR